MNTIADKADLIFTGGRVHTMDVGDRFVEAVAIADNRIVAVGSDRDVLALKQRATRVVELRGRSLLPGFIDAHCHVAFLGSFLAGINCKAPGMESIERIVAAIRARASIQPKGTWIRVSGYDQARLVERRHPNRFDLDAASPDHPVAITRTCGHIRVFNTCAMELASVDDSTPDPPGGRFDRADGRNLGIAYEAAFAPFAKVSAPSVDEKRADFLRAQEAYLAAGVTSVHDAGLLDLGVAQELHSQGLVRLRVYALAVDALGDTAGTRLVKSGVRTGFGDEWLRIGAYKVLADGSSSGPTAATRQPYASDPNDYGMLNVSQTELDELLLRAHHAGFQLTAHAVGDRAIEAMLAALASTTEAVPRSDLRHRIEHCAMLPPDLQERVVSQGIIPIMQPAFLWEFGDGYIANYGRHRADVMFPVKSLVDRGVRVAGSSDAPVTDHRPLFGIQQAITRRTAGGDVCGPYEIVDLQTAIRMHTINGAYASFEETRKGSIEVGKLADLVMLDEDIAQVPSENLAQVPVAMTIGGGKVVHEASL